MGISRQVCAPGCGVINSPLGASPGLNSCQGSALERTVFEAPPRIRHGLVN